MRRETHPIIIYPVTGEDVRQSLDIARTQTDTFGVNEKSWLVQNNPRLALITETAFAIFIENGKGIYHAEAALAGQLLANHAVRLALDEKSLYQSSFKNFLRNTLTDTQQLSVSTAIEAHSIMSERRFIAENFNDNTLVEALMGVKDLVARSHAAVYLGLFCLDFLPQTSFKITRSRRRLSRPGRSGSPMRSVGNS